MKQFLFILLLLPLTLSAQKKSVTVSSTVLDYGVIKEGDDRIREVVVENISPDTILILKMQVPSEEFSVRFSRKKLPPAEKAVVRVKYNPRKKGKFGAGLVLHTSAQSIDMKATGKTEYLEWADFTPCPDFQKSADAPATNFEVNFKVIDVKTLEPIDGAEITLRGRTQGEFKLTSNRKGTVVATLPIDFYEIGAKKKGYGKYEMESYINKRNKDFTLKLLIGESSHTVVMIGDRPEPPKIGEEAAEVVQEEQAEVVKEEEEKEVPERDVIRLVRNEFSIEEFKPNNVVFLIDVSTSMQKEERMKLLKESMVSLTRMLRPEDRLSIVTYASTTDVVMSGESVTDQAKIIEVINGLEGKGMTAGEAGIKKAYNIARKNRIEGGNNQVYLATDGAFNKGGEAIAKLVKKEAKKGTYMSILSIRGSKWARNKMETISDAGQGNYLLIEEFDTAAESLKSMVRSQAGR